MPILPFLNELFLKYFELQSMLSLSGSAGRCRSVQFSAVLIYLCGTSTAVNVSVPVLDRHLADATAARCTLHFTALHCTALHCTADIWLMLLLHAALPHTIIFTIVENN
jgi:hypothetical protein